MSPEQKKAARSLKRALEVCHASGLQGGVYDGSFCLWPAGAPHPHESHEFFSGVEDVGGEVLESSIHLDGGAGN